jgi:hypothetical protein
MKKIIYPVFLTLSIVVLVSNHCAQTSEFVFSRLGYDKISSATIKHLPIETSEQIENFCNYIRPLSKPYAASSKL